MASRKAQGLSTETIIIVVLALLVLAISAAIWISKSRQGNEALSSCTNLGGQCESSGQCPAERPFHNPFGATQCKKDAQTGICCAGAPGSAPDDTQP